MFSCSRTSSPGSATCTTAAPCQERQNEVAACEVAEKDLQEGMQEGKEQIKELNERFAKYINNTVLNLQRKNKELLAELKKLEKEEFIAVEKAYQKDYQDFQARVDEIQNELVLLKLEKDKLKARLEKECQLKREFDRDFQHLKKSYEDATAGLEKLQCQYKLLEAQLAQLKLVRDQERIYWQQKVDNLQNLDQAESNTLDLEQALRNMRQEYDQMARRNKEELQRYRHKFEENSVPLQKIKKETETYRNMVTDLRLRDEMHKNHLQEKEREISRIKEYNKSLDKKIEAQTTDFQTLVAVKNGLEQELSGYKSLLNQVEKKDEVGAPGIVIGVSVNGKEVWSEGLGYADVENRVLCNPETVMRIASISKSLTMTAVAKLWEAGKLDFDAPVQKYVPEFPEKEYEREKVTITTRLLLSHLSGIRHYEKDIKKVQKQKEKDKMLVKEEVGSKASDQDSKEKGDTEKQKETLKRRKEGDHNKRPKSESNSTENSGQNNKTIQIKADSDYSEFYIKEKFDSVFKSLELFENDPLMFKPGSQFLYSTHAWTLLSAVVERAAEQDFLQHMKKLFLDLDMLQTVPDEHEPIIYNRARHYVYNKKGRLVNCPYVDCSYKWAGGGFLSTVHDLLRFGNAMLYSYQVEAPEGREQTQLPGYLRPATVSMIWSPVQNTELSWDREGRYAMGWGVVEQSQEYGQGRYRRHYLSHTGGAVGVSSVLLLLPGDPRGRPVGSPPQGVVVSILCNLQSVNLNSTALKIALEFDKVRAGEPPSATSDPTSQYQLADQAKASQPLKHTSTSS